MKKVAAIIPARMGASRFPGKPLADILGLPMIEHVRRRVSLSSVVDDVFVATCDQEIMEVVQSFGGNPVMTAPGHDRCTDRVREVAEHIEHDIVVIVQGDEPLFNPDVLEKLVAPMLSDETVHCANLLSVIHDSADLDNIDIVKAVLNENNLVMYFSRSPIPFFRVQNDCPMYRQTGISAFTRKFLMAYSRLSPTPLEEAESVDFLRILEHSYPILGVIWEHETVGVDRAEDVKVVESILREDDVQKKLHELITKRDNLSVDPSDAMRRKS